MPHIVLARTTAALILIFAFSILSIISVAAGDEILLDTRGGTFTLPVRLNNTITLNFVLDTGAADVAIPADVVSTLLRSGTLTDRDFVGRATYVMADGSKLPSLRFVLREISIGNHSVGNVVASVSPVRGDPLLGQSFLSRLPRWTIDYPRSVFVVGETPSVSQNTGVLPRSTSPASISVPNASLYRDGAFGAFAHDASSGQFGFSWNEYDPLHADQAALKGCASDKCKIVFRTGTHECAAIAMNPDGKVWGGAKRPKRDAAELAAIENCQKRTPGQCKVRGAECNR